MASFPGQSVMCRSSHWEGACRNSSAGGTASSGTTTFSPRHTSTGGGSPRMSAMPSSSQPFTSELPWLPSTSPGRPSLASSSATSSRACSASPCPTIASSRIVPFPRRSGSSTSSHTAASWLCRAIPSTGSRRIATTTEARRLSTTCIRLSMASGGRTWAGFSMERAPGCDGTSPTPRTCRRSSSTASCRRPMLSMPSCFPSWAFTSSAACPACSGDSSRALSGSGTSPGP
mmetsp:Transcript_38827/g.85015  ORF Transcript_38827/g.85015 Transcript_38827/m.85015 type:complete len:231 (+) Transcript_38827:344-1036(+)